MDGRPCTDVGQARPDNLQAAFRNTHRQSSRVLAHQGVTGQQLDLLIVVLPDANAGVRYGKQVKWLLVLVVVVAYFLYALLLKHYLRRFYHAGRIKRLCETELVVITVLQ
jgi:uncharacterized membrane protein